MGRRSATGGVEPKGERIQITFEWRGRRLRPTLALRPTAANLKAAQRIREQLLLDIRMGRFELARYFPDYRPPADLGGLPTDVPTFRRAGDLWLKSIDVAHSTRVGYRNALAYYWYPKLGDTPIRDVGFEAIIDVINDHVQADESDTGISPKTRNNILTPLRGAFDAAVAERWIKVNPALLVKSSRLQRPLPDPFSLEEVERILAALRKLAHGEALADYFEFACFAGLRTSEQIALTWSDVDTRQMAARIHQIRTHARNEARTKTYVERTVELNARAAAVIRRQEARTRLAGQHVFVDPATGAGWNRSNDVRDVWAQAVRLAGVRYRPPKETRDTSVTFALQSGADPQYVAAQHGHSLTVMMKNYARWIPGGDAGRNRARIDAALGFATDAPPESKKA